MPNEYVLQLTEALAADGWDVVPHDAATTINQINYFCRRVCVNCGMRGLRYVPASRRAAVGRRECRDFGVCPGCGRVSEFDPILAKAAGGQEGGAA